MNSIKKNPFSDFLFFIGLVITSVFILISILTLKNECNFLQSEIYHLDNVKILHKNKVQVLSANVNNLSRQDRIEKFAYDNFQLHIPTPESLIVYIEGIK